VLFRIVSRSRFGVGTHDAIHAGMTSRPVYFIQAPILPPRQSATLISRLGPLLNRPLLIGVAAVVASVIICGVVVQTRTVSEVNEARMVEATPSASHRHLVRDDELSPLFLILLGLAAFALSQTRSPEQSAPRKDHFYAGKKIARGQKLPEVREPQPPIVLGSGVIAREHHHDVVGLESVVGLGMLHK
jgi:hypothetical protein